MTYNLYSLTTRLSYIEFVEVVLTNRLACIPCVVPPLILSILISKDHGMFRALSIQASAVDTRKHVEFGKAGMRQQQSSSSSQHHDS